MLHKTLEDVYDAATRDKANVEVHPKKGVPVVFVTLLHRLRKHENPFSNTHVYFSDNEMMVCVENTPREQKLARQACAQGTLVQVLDYTKIFPQPNGISFGLADFNEEE